MPQQHKMVFLSPTTVTAADVEKAKVSGIAYAGGQLDLGWGAPVVVELSGMKIPDNIPLLANHENKTGSRVGVVAVSINGNEVQIDGEIIATNDAAKEIIVQAKAGLDWQLSIGAAVVKETFVPDGESVKANDSTHDGPFYHVTASKLREVSVVPVGADSETSMKVAASLHLIKKENLMDFTAWLKSHEISADGLDEEQLKTLQASYDAAEAPPAEFKAANPPKDDEGAKGEEGERGHNVIDFQAAVTAAAEKASEKVLKAQLEAQKMIVANAAEIFSEGHESLKAQAIAEHWSKERMMEEELKALRAGLPGSPSILQGMSTEFESEVVEAALCKSTSLQGYEKKFDEKVLDAADKKYAGEIGLKQVILEAARSRGYQGGSWRNGQMGSIMQAAFSNLSLPGILSNLANKFIAQGFNNVESGWREVTAINTVTDFKQISSYALTGDFDFELLGADAEIKHGTTAETTYNNQADTYARMYSITRRDIINDDLGMLSDIPSKIGRGGATKLNKVFWTDNYLADAATFYTAARGNLETGGGSALASAGLTAAQLAFRRQTDPDSEPLGIDPSIIVVPPDLEVTLLELLRSVKVKGDTDGPDVNVWTGRYTPVVSTYITDTTEWFLQAAPSVLAVIETVFLNGNQTPIVDNAEAEFNTLGIQMRGYFDFGVAKQEYRACVKSDGA